MTKEIKLTHGFVALVDDEDFYELSKYTWRASSDYRTYYALRSVREYKKIKNLSMHRQIMDFPENMLIDHINHNGLDNRKENLRICTPAQNTFNRIKVKSITGYKALELFGEFACINFKESYD